jgi:hypothetical protein
MGLNKIKAAICLAQANGNVAEGMVRYIADNGCNGFRCKECPIKLVCSKKPTESKDYASYVLVQVLKQKSSQTSSESKLKSD